MLFASRNDAAYKNPKEKRLQDQVNTIMLKIAPYISEVQFEQEPIVAPISSSATTSAPSPFFATATLSSSKKWTFMTKLKIFMCVSALYLAYSSLCGFLEYVSTFLDDLRSMDVTTFFPRLWIFASQDPSKFIIVFDWKKKIAQFRIHTAHKTTLRIKGSVIYYYIILYFFCL